MITFSLFADFICSNYDLTLERLADNWKIDIETLKQWKYKRGFPRGRGRGVITIHEVASIITSPPTDILCKFGTVDNIITHFLKYIKEKGYPSNRVPNIVTVSEFELFLDQFLRERINNLHNGCHPQKIDSFVIPPVSKEKYISRPIIESDIKQSLHTNKITVIRGMSGLGKSELARKVATDESDFSTVIRLELENDGSGNFAELLDSQVRITEIPENIDSLECKKGLLRTAGQDFLIVVDNLNNINNYSFLQSLANSTGSAKILITSQIQEAKLNDFSRSFKIQASVIDLEMDKYSQKEFAPMVFCSYAELVYGNLTVDEQYAVQAICNHVAGHTMIVAALGLRMKKYGDYARKLLITMVEDVNNCMANIRVKLKKDMDVTSSLTAYEILKGLSISLLQRNYTTRERQVLGAVILLPPKHRNRDLVEELVGDLPEVNCFEASDAIERLHDDGVLQITANEDLCVHPLYVQLLSDCGITFKTERNEQQSGPIAELSDSFRFHLLRNGFVSHKKSVTNELRLFYLDLEPDASNAGSWSFLSDNAGWFLVFYSYWYYFSFSMFTINFKKFICSGINVNHKNIGLSTRITNDDLDRFVDKVTDPPNNLFNEPRSKSAFVQMEHTNGKSLWLYDFEKKNSWCILDYSKQRLPAYRYFEGKKAVVHADKRIVDAEIVGYYMFLKPKKATNPTHVYADGSVPIKTLQYPTGRLIGTHWGPKLAFIQAKECIKKAHKASSKGDLSDAIGYLHTAMAIIDARPEFFYDQAQSKGYLLLAEEFAVCRAYDEALICLERVNPKEVARDRWLFYKGFLESKAGRHEEALTYKIQALEIDTDKYNDSIATDTNSYLHTNGALLAIASDHNSIGETLTALENYDQALIHLKKALEIRRRLLPDQHWQFSLSYENMGDLYARIGDADSLRQARTYYEKAKSVIIAVHGDGKQSETRLQEKINELQSILITQELETQ